MFFYKKTYRILIKINKIILFLIPVNNILQDEIDKMNNMGKCTICMEVNANRVIEPCHHLVCCNNCVRRVKDCPICRRPIKSLIIVVFHKKKKKVSQTEEEDIVDRVLRNNNYFGFDKLKRK